VPAGEIVEANAAIQRQPSAGAVEVNKAAWRYPVDLRVKGGVPREIFELEKITERLPVPAPSQS
jgi:hypothetical protein